MIQTHTSTTLGGGVRLTQVHAGHEGDMPQPVPMVHHGGVGAEIGQITTLLCRLPQAQCTYQEGLAANSGSTGEYGGHRALLHNGF